MIVQQENDQVVQSKSDNSSRDKKKVFFIKTFVAFKGPVSVQNKVSAGGKGKSAAVGKVFIEEEQFLQRVSNAKIPQKAGKTNDSKLDQSGKVFRVSYFEEEIQRFPFLIS